MMKRRLQMVVALFAVFMQSFVYGQTFDCNNNLYQVVNGKDLKVLDPSTGTYSDIGSASVTYNGAGFNYEDGYLYGISTNRLVRIDNTGTATDLGLIGSFNAIHYTADLDTLGNWHSFRKASGNWKMTIIDVSETPPVAQDFSMTELSGAASSGVCNDISYNAVTNKFYGMTSGKLHEFDHINRTVKVIADYSATTSSGGYGAAWSDDQGNTYFFNNGSGNIYRASFDSSGNILSFGFTATSQPNGNNDGMSCPLAAPPVFPEVCDNGLDDDGDGLIDCNDPDCTSTVSCGVAGVVFSSDFACHESIVTYHAFFTNNSTLTNTLTVTEVLPAGFTFFQDSLSFDAGGSSDFSQQPVTGDMGTIQWGTITLEGGETVKISYDVTLDNTASIGTNTNNITVSLGVPGTIFDPSVLTSDILVSSCPTSPNTFVCEPAFYQVYKKRGKNQPNVYGKLDPITGDYNQIAIASDRANGLGYDINTGLVFGASGKRFIRLDEDGYVIDQGITFTKNVFRGDVNENSEWYGVDGSNMVKIDISGTPTVVATYTGQGLPGWDIAYNKDGNFYSLHSNQVLYKFNTTTNTKSTVGTISGIGIPSSGGYGAQWTGSDGYLYASHNSTGTILRVDVTTGEARKVSSSIDGLSLNDGFSCPLDIPAVYEFDYGDNSSLPQSRVLSYRQDLSNDGLPDYATVWLGNTVDFDTSNPANATADGDTDDGVSVNTRITNGVVTATIGLNANESLTLYYGIGADWDDDGTFDNFYSGNMAISGASQLVQDLTPPVGFITGNMNLRVLVSEEVIDQSKMSGDILAMGEVEDYRLLITSDENCSNGIDDDADGLTDCDDPDCSGVGSCPEEPTGPGGGDGGLESNNRLSGKIAKVQFQRSKTTRIDYNNKAELRKIGRTKEYGRKSPRRRGISTGTIEQFIPLDVLPETESFVTSPEHLIGITNANEVFAVDVFRENSRVATVLALTSENGVYEHTKYVCDRLNGSQIVDILEYTIDGEHEFHIAKLRTAGGNLEYATSFSIKEENEGFGLESYWNLAFYTPNVSFYNFQIWANSTNSLFQLVEEVIRLLNVQSPINTFNIGELPGVYVNRAQLKGGQLSLDITNRNATTSLHASGVLSESETSNTREFDEFINLSGSEKQNVKVTVGSVYDLGLTFHDDQDEMPDVIFMADGAWGTDYDATVEEVTGFTVDPGYIDDQNAFGLERNVHISGGVTNSVAVFRSFSPSFRSADMSNYNTLSFEARGTGTVEVTLVKSSVREWVDQPRALVTLSEEERTFNLNQKFFSELNSQSLTWEDLTMVVFDVKGNGSDMSSFEMRLSNVAFRQSAITGIEDALGNNSLNVYPNPAAEVLNVSFDAEGPGEYSMELFSQDGRSMKMFTGSVQQGENNLQFTDLPRKRGLYLYRLKLNDGTIFQGKTYINNK